MNKSWVLAALGFGIILVLWLWLAPPRFLLNWTKRVDLSDPVRTGERLVERYRCRDCHRILGEGALKAPDLAGVTRRLTRQELELWLKDPDAVKKDTAMPDFHLSDTEIVAIMAYFEALDLK